MNHDNILLSELQPREAVFINPQRGGEKTFRTEDNALHGSKLLEFYKNGFAQGSNLFQGKTISLVFRGVPVLSDKVKSLENAKKDIRLLNVKTVTDMSSNETTFQAVVSIPKQQKNVLKDHIDAYRKGERTRRLGVSGKIKYQDLMNSIDEIICPKGRSVWLGGDDSFPEDEVIWCECWIRSSKEDASGDWAKVQEYANANSLQLSDTFLVFEQQIVFLAQMNGPQIDAFLYGMDRVSCIRKAPVAVPFFSRMERREQNAWVGDLQSRVLGPQKNDAPSVTLLDEGVNYYHPLLKPFVDPNCVVSQDAQPPFDVGNDKHPHATLMAGVIGYGDLANCLANSNSISIPFWVESMRIFPNNAHTPLLYGSVTKQGVTVIEHNEHHRQNSVFCMPITESSDDERQSQDCDGTPSSWSTVIDLLAFGDGADKRRLFVLCVGNIIQTGFGYQYPATNTISPAESPSQAWNALSVGAYADKVLDSQTSSHHSVAKYTELCPTSRTSCVWNYKSAPIKPDVVLPGGNLDQQEGETACLHSEELSSLTTRHFFRTDDYFDLISDTSEATAHAARMAACLMERYHSFWPETIRGLIVHSAIWSPSMEQQFSDPKERLSCFGYGIPHLDLAMECADNRVNLIKQGTFVPLRKVQNIKQQFMQYFELPWPKDTLTNLGNVVAELRITLSYFIEPNPGHVGSITGHQYNSQSLEFEVKSASESLADFKKRVNKSEREEGEGVDSANSLKWQIGKRYRNKGSLHSDFVRTSAVNLANCDCVAIYPKKGWWYSVKEKIEKPIRYALIVTISTPRQDVPLLAEVLNKIESKVSTPISIATTNRDSEGEE
jgi:hypothetical protein